MRVSDNDDEDGHDDKMLDHLLHSPSQYGEDCSIQYTQKVEISCYCYNNLL